jgi:mannose/fructose/N-acetylgalactosamine-specific phosphotransferase system component IIC
MLILTCLIVGATLQLACLFVSALAATNLPPEQPHQ